jgi:hypothetical protein
MKTSLHYCSHYYGFWVTTGKDKSRVNQVLTNRGDVITFAALSFIFMKPVYSLSRCTERYCVYSISVTEKILLDPLKHEFLLNNIQNLVPISQETHFHLYYEDQLVDAVYRNTDVYSEYDTKNVNISCCQNVEFSKC